MQSGQPVMFLRLPVRDEVFAARGRRLRQLAVGHAMHDSLVFAAELAEAQHRVLADPPPVALPSLEALDEAAGSGRALLDPTTWTRDPRWRAGLARLLETLSPRLAGSPASASLRRLQGRPAEWLELQSDRLLNGLRRGVDMASAPFIGAALQLHFTQLVLAVEERHGADRLAPFGRADDATRCPCCASRPTAGVAITGSDAGGYRYLHCSLCSSNWSVARGQCTHCRGTHGLQRLSLAAGRPRDGDAGTESAEASAAVLVETCEGCGHYLKIVHRSRDPHADPVADDLASLTLDIRVSQAGLQRHGQNLMLFFGEGDPDEAQAQPPAA